MKIPSRTLQHRNRQEGALIILTLLILLVVSMLGMAAIDSTGLEMKMSSNSRTQQQAFEAAEYTLSWVENDIVANGYFSDVSIKNATGCGSVCFSSACTNGYCFSGITPEHWDNCRVSKDAALPSESAAFWATASGKYKTLNVPNLDITAKYIIEFWCYTALDPDLPKTSTNNTRLFRITAFTTGEGGKARAMLRSTIKEI